MVGGSIGVLALGVMFVGGALGLLLGKLLPEKYHGAPTERLVQGSMRMISYLSILVLGLLVATAKSKFDSNNSQVEHFAANLMLLNSELTALGPTGSETKTLLRKYVAAKIATMWGGQAGPGPEPSDPPALHLLESLQQKLLSVAPESEYQRSMARGASEVLGELTRAKWLLAAQESDHVPQPFLWVLIAWLSLLFVGLGLFAPHNALAFAALLLSAVSLSGAIALIEDMDTPFAGLILVSPEPMQAALAQINSP
jgi:hypothetical protein